jgi:DNA-binding transcriptional LysR family regulator
MYPSIEELVAFVHIVEAGSISAAARKLDLSKSVVSARLTSLEARLAVSLLRRTTRTMALTDAGTGFYEQARDILDRLEEAGAEATREGGAAGMLHGHLRITAPVSFGSLHLGPLLMPFFVENPHLHCEIQLDDKVVDLVEGKFDLAIRIGRMPDSSLVARRVGMSRRVACASPAYIARAGEPGHPDDLRQHAFIGYANSSAAMLWTLTAEDGSTVIASSARPALTANNGELIRDAAIAGLGLAVLPRFIVEDALEAGKLVPVMTRYEPVSEAIQLVYPQERRLPLKTRALIDFLVTTFADSLW